MSSSEADFHAVAVAAKEAATQLVSLSRQRKDAALLAIADALQSNAGRIAAANAVDTDRARTNGTSPALVDRLTLDEQRINVIADAVRHVAQLPDPVGEVVRGYTLPNGLQVRQVRVPLGVVGMIYEARPNVTVDAATLALKSGNAALLRGSSSAYNTNVVLVEVMREALEKEGISPVAISLVPGTSHESVKELLNARGLVDVIIPRGGADLINSVVENATVPVIETGVGNCHVYVDEAADISKAIQIILNAKTQRVSVCNAAETMLVHAGIAGRFMPVALRALDEAGVTIHGDSRTVERGEREGIAVKPVTDVDWACEYYSMDLAVGIVDSIDGAMEHIRSWSSGHTEAIVSDSQSAIQAFVTNVDSAAIMVNASTRFTDGGEFGFGAEIGISTQKLHARGPMGLSELTTTKYIVTGDGHVRP